VLVRVQDGREEACHVTPYRHGVITEKLPNSDLRLGLDWALQHPDDYLEVLRQSVPAVLRQSGVQPEQIIGIGIDFTACTMLPVDAAFNPLCMQGEWKDHPHAWVKLWKHHAAQAEATLINEIAEKREENWLRRYGGKISSEWMLPKSLQILHEAPDVYEAADLFLEAGDWIVMQMTGQLARNSCAAGYKSQWHDKHGNPSADFLKELHPDFGDVYESKLRGPVVPLGNKAGELLAPLAKQMGLLPGTAVAIGNIDAHAAVPAVGVVGPGQLVMVMGTSTCHMLLAEDEHEVEGICGVVKDGIIPGFYGYEAGQSAVGDIFAWFVDHAVPAAAHVEAEVAGLSIHAYLEKKASLLQPGQSGLIALDWFNGNRSVLMDADLSGILLELTLSTKPEEIYRALLEATAFGTRSIVDTFRRGGIDVRELVACGGLPQKNELLMQIYADVTNMEIRVSETMLTPCVGSAMFAAVAAGASAGGYATIQEAAASMAKLKKETVKPNPAHTVRYSAMYEAYTELHEHFGKVSRVMKRVKAWKEA
jgi:L-ribulokinase